MRFQFMLRLLLLLIVAISNQCLAQKLHSKDGVYLGERSELMGECVRAGNGQLLEIGGISIDFESYCGCLADQLLPSIYSYEFAEAAENDAIDALLARPDLFELLMNCLEDKVEIADDFNYGQLSDPKVLDVAVRSCAFEMQKDPSLAGVFDEMSALAYCACVMEELTQKGLTYRDVLDAETEGSIALIEVGLPCLETVLGFELFPEVFNNVYDPADIYGSEDEATIPLKQVAGAGYQVKIGVEGIERYFLFDTGASDMCIDHALEQRLLTEGKISPVDYLGENDYQLADNSVVSARMVRLNNITIGDFRVDNVIVAVIDGGSLLCGIGFLDKFSNWEFDGKMKELRLER